MRASIRGDNVGSLNETGLNGCFCARDIGAITEGVIEKLKRGYIYGVYRYDAFNWIFIFIRERVI